MKNSYIMISPYKACNKPLLLKPRLWWILLSVFLFFLEASIFLLQQEDTLPMLTSSSHQTDIQQALCCPFRIDVVAVWISIRDTIKLYFLHCWLRLSCVGGATGTWWSRWLLFLTLQDLWVPSLVCWWTTPFDDIFNMNWLHITGQYGDMQTAVCCVFTWHHLIQKSLCFFPAEWQTEQSASACVHTQMLLQR